MGGEWSACSGRDEVVGVAAAEGSGRGDGESVVGGRTGGAGMKVAREVADDVEGVLALVVVGGD